MKNDTKRKQRQSMDVACKPEWAAKVKAAAKKFPGSPNPSMFVRLVVDQYLRSMDQQRKGTHQCF